MSPPFMKNNIYFVLSIPHWTLL